MDFLSITKVLPIRCVGGSESKPETIVFAGY